MLKDLNLTINTKENIAKIITYADKDTEKLKELMTYFLGDNARISQVTSWAVGHIGESQPMLFKPYHSQLLARFKNRQNHNAIRRNIARIYQFIEIPQHIESELFDLCLQAILSPYEAIAIRAFCMTIGERIATKYQELIPELTIAIESTYDTGTSGIRNRAMHTLQRLKKRSRYT